METNNSGKVQLEQMKLRQVLIEKEMKIPPYQRIYCWKEKTVKKLLKDLWEHEYDKDKPFCIGSIIIQDKGNNKFDVIDGQQRLVTLSLLLLITNPEEANKISLLNEQFFDSEAQKYIAYNKYLINKFCQKYSFDKKNVLDNILLNVLILKDGSLDLAYTFFSNVNSRGAKLTDYDLLKAHHLRYVVSDKQQLHLAKRWDAMIQKEKPEGADRQEHDQALSLYLFRLRKWLCLDRWNESDEHNVKQEFERANIIEEIPPFCERFAYYEPIQGGTHFFEYTDRAIEKLRGFVSTPEYKKIHKLHDWHDHLDRMGDVIEALLFAYYYKFGSSYLTEAMLLITRYMSQVKYEYKPLYQSRIFEYARTSQIVLDIERFSSPTFFLAYIKEKNEGLRSLSQVKHDEKKEGKNVDGKDIRERYNIKLANICFKDIDNNNLVIKELNKWD